ncbi:MAG TPA: gliding motility-associated C-terminal domain-containing protein [Candidatus Acidoferrales bacterium]|nr:gliding motility-associated C-terminal domain-containing protein [Candidatus Acidoferrales bacterium]
MKKVLILGSILFVSNSLLGNPLPDPHATILEFRFDPANKWELEIGTPVLYANYYDSICISTSGGIARVKIDSTGYAASVLVITPDSLLSPLSINDTGDCITVYSYISNKSFGEISMKDTLSFGNYPGSTLDSIPTGYSICRFHFYFNPDNSYDIFCLRKNSTIGASYDTSGCCATMTGNMYDKNNKKITGGAFTLDYPVTFNAESSYSTRVLARKCAISGMFQGTSATGWYWWWTDTVSIDAYPDSLIRRDLHFTDLVGIKERPAPSNHDLYVINYPNPFNPATNFYVRIPDQLKRKEGRIDIYNSIGQKVFVVPLSNASTYEWNGVDMSGKAVASGVYYYRLVFDYAVSKTGSMILLK